MEQARRQTGRSAGWIWIVLGVVLVAALSARLYRLHTISLWTDELYHVVAAMSWTESGGLTVPGYGVYRRAMPITAATCGAMLLLGEGELAVRLPFVVIGLAVLVLIFMILRRWVGAGTAILVAIVLALSPHELQWTREVRMYGPLQLLYFAAAAAAWYALESQRHRAAWAAASVALWAMAAWLNLLAVNLAVTLGLYALICVALDARQRGMHAALRTPHAGLCAAMLVAVLLVAAVLPGVVGRLVTLATAQPVWETQKPADLFYAWMFTTYYPWLVLMYPIGAVWLVRRHGRLGVFIVCAFVPLMLLHIYVFTGRVAERYMAYLLPFFLIPPCYLAASVSGAAWRRWRTGGKNLRSHLRTATLSACAVILLAGVMYPWPLYSPGVIRWGVGPDWQSASALMRQLAEDHVVLTTWPREVRYYGGRFPDYILTVNYERDERGDHVVQIGERQVAVRYLTTAEQVAELLDAGGRVCLITTAWALDNPAFVSEPTRRLIEQRMTPVLEATYGNDALLFYAATSPDADAGHDGP